MPPAHHQMKETSETFWRISTKSAIDRSITMAKWSWHLNTRRTRRTMSLLYLNTVSLRLSTQSLSITKNCSKALNKAKTLCSDTCLRCSFTACHSESVINNVLSLHQCTKTGWSCQASETDYADSFSIFKQHCLFEIVLLWTFIWWIQSFNTYPISPNFFNNSKEL